MAIRMATLKINSPAVVEEGEFYTVKLTVKNQTFKGGTPVEANLTIGISAGADSIPLISARESSEPFVANETRSFQFTLEPPLGSGGKVGFISAWVDDPAGNTLDSATESVTIKEKYSPAVPPSTASASQTIEGHMVKQADVYYYITISKATDSFLIGTTIQARSDENLIQIIGKDFSANLKVITVTTGNPYVPYIRQWYISNVKILLFGYPPEAFKFSCSITWEKFTYLYYGYPAGPQYAPHIRVYSSYGLSRFSVGLFLTSPQGTGNMGVSYSGYANGSEIVFKGEFRGEPGLDLGNKVAVYAHPNPGEHFDRPDYATQRGWVFVKESIAG